MSRLYGTGFWGKFWGRVFGVFWEWQSGVGGARKMMGVIFLRSVGVVDLKKSVVEFWEADLV